MSNNLNLNNMNIPTELSNLITNLGSEQINATPLSPLQTTDIMNIATIFPNLNASLISTIPTLSLPHEITPFRPEQHTDLTNENFEQFLNNALNQFPEMRELLAFDPSAQQKLANKLKNLNSGKLNPFNFAQQTGKAMGQLIMEKMKENPQLANQLTTLLDSVRAKTFGEHFPNIDIAIDKKAQELIDEGVKPSKAQQQARSFVLNLIDAQLKEQGVFQTMLGTHPKLGGIIDNVVKEVLQSSYGEVGGLALGAGIANAMNLSNNIGSFFENVALNQTQAINPKNIMSPDKAFAIMKGVVNTMNSAQHNGEAALNTLGHLMSADLKTEHSQWLRDLGHAISELKTVLNEMEMELATKSQALSQQKNEQTDLVQKYTMKKLTDESKKLNKPFIVRFFEKLGMILASIIMNTIGAIGAIFCGGASLAITVAVTVTLFVLTTVLSETGILAKGFQKMMAAVAKAIEQIGGGPALQAMCKFFTALALVAVVVVATVASRSGAGMTAISAALAKSVGQEMAMATVRFATLEIGVTLITTMVTSTNLFESLAQTMTNDPVKQAYIAMAFSLVFTIAMGGLTIMGGLNNVNKSINDQVTGALKKAEQLFKSQEIEKAAYNQLKGLTNAQEIQEVCNNLVKSGQMSAQAAQKITSSIPPQFSNKLNQGLAVLQSIATITEAITSVSGAAYDLKIAKLQKETKELEGTIELIKQMIRSLEKLLAGGTEEMDDVRAFSNKLGEFFDQVIGNLSGTLSKLTAA